MCGSLRWARCRSHSSLGALLGPGGTLSVLLDIRGIVELLDTVLDALPHLAGCRWSTLGTDQRVHPGAQQGERVAEVWALREAGADEDGVQGDQDPRPALEEDGGQQQAEPEEDLESRHYRHARGVVLLAKVANLLSQSAFLLRAVGRRRRDGRDQGIAGVGGDVEDRVDAVGQESQRVLRRDEPDKGKDCSRELWSVIWASIVWDNRGLQRYKTFSSE